MNKFQTVSQFLENISERVPQFIKSQEQMQSKTRKERFEFTPKNHIKPCITLYDRLS